MKTTSDNSREKKPLNKKGLTTFLLFLSSLIISFSGIVLYISPKTYAPVVIERITKALPMSDRKNMGLILETISGAWAME